MWTTFQIISKLIDHIRKQFRTLSTVCGNILVVTASQPTFIVTTHPTIQCNLGSLQKYEFEHVTSSPQCSRGNGKAENAFRNIKKLMKKAKEDNSNIFIALIGWRNRSLKTSSSPLFRSLWDVVVNPNCPSTANCSQILLNQIFGC